MSADSEDLSIEKQRLENEKLSAEVEQLRRPYHFKPSNWIAATTAIVAVAGVFFQYIFSKHEYRLAEIAAREAKVDRKDAEYQANIAEEKVKAANQEVSDAEEVRRSSEKLANDAEEKERQSRNELNELQQKRATLFADLRTASQLAELGGRILLSDDEIPQVDGVEFYVGEQLKIKDLDRVVESLEQQTDLERIDIIFSFVGDLSNQEFTAAVESLKQLRKLTRISLEWARIRISDTSLAHLSKLHNLRELDLVNSGVTDDGLAHLASLKQLERIWIGHRRFAVEETHITDAGLVHIGKLSKLRTVSIDMVSPDDQAMKISDEGLNHLKKLEDLEELVITGSDLTDVGLDNLIRWPKLTFLGIAGQKQITIQGIKKIASVHQLEGLSLSSTNVDDEALRHLHTLSKLRFISLYATEVSDAAIAELKRALPDCEVRR